MAEIRTYGLGRELARTLERTSTCSRSKPDLSRRRDVTRSRRQTSGTEDRHRVLKELRRGRKGFPWKVQEGLLVEKVLQTSLSGGDSEEQHSGRGRKGKVGGGEGKRTVVFSLAQ